MNLLSVSPLISLSLSTSISPLIAPSIPPFSLSHFHPSISSSIRAFILLSIPHCISPSILPSFHHYPSSLCFSHFCFAALRLIKDMTKTTGIDLFMVLYSIADPYNFPGSGSVPGFLGSGSISYSNEHNKINWKGKFNKVCLLVGSWWTY